MPTYATEEEKAKPLKVAYTAMHGVGGKWVHRAFELFHPDALQVHTYGSHSLFYVLYFIFYIIFRGLSLYRNIVVISAY